MTVAELGCARPDDTYCPVHDVFGHAHTSLYCAGLQVQEGSGITLAHLVPTVERWADALNTDADGVRAWFVRHGFVASIRGNYLVVLTREYAETQPWSVTP